MKTFFNILLAAAACLVFAACEKDEEKTILRIGESSALYASATHVVMQEALANDNAIAFTWTPAEFGYSASTTYTLQLALTEDGFADEPVTDEVGTGVFRQEYTVLDFNAIVMKLGIPAGSAQNVLVRVQANVANTNKVSYSDPVTVNVTPYVSEPPYATLYLVGDAVEFGWDAAKATPMFRDESNPFVYTFTGYFKAGELKVLGYLNNWVPQWGSGGDGKLAISETNDDTDPPSLRVTAAGYYTFAMDLQFNTYKLISYDASAAASYATVGIAGDFDNWGNKTPMATTAFNPHVWGVELTLAADSNIKFATPDWSTQWGISSDWSRLYGKAAAGGSGNMWIYAGTYRFLFNDLDGRYVLVK